jgi:hypothetical protein
VAAKGSQWKAGANTPPKGHERETPARARMREAIERVGEFRRLRDEHRAVSAARREQVRQARAARAALAQEARQVDVAALDEHDAGVLLARHVRDPRNISREDWKNPVVDKLYRELDGEVWDGARRVAIARAATEGRIETGPGQGRSRAGERIAERMNHRFDESAPGPEQARTVAVLPGVRGVVLQENVPVPPHLGYLLNAGKKKGARARAVPESFEGYKAKSKAYQKADGAVREAREREARAFWDRSRLAGADAPQPERAAAYDRHRARVSRAERKIVDAARNRGAVEDRLRERWEKARGSKTSSGSEPT